MKNRAGTHQQSAKNGATPTLSAIRRQLAYLQEEVRENGYPEVSLFLGCAVLAIDDLGRAQAVRAT